MANKNQPERWESVIFAAALALAGTLFLFDKLASFPWMSTLLSQDVLRFAPVFLAVIGVSLVLADPGAKSEGRNQHRPSRRPL